MVAGFDEDPDASSGPLGAVEDAHLVVDEAHRLELRVVGEEGLAQGGVHGVHGPVALRGGVHHLVPDPDLDGRLADQGLAGALLDEGDEVDELEGRPVSPGAVDEHLEGGLRPLEGVAAVLQLLHLVGDLPGQGAVPVDVDAIIFWVVIDVRRAALEVANYGAAIAWAAQTSLREMIGAADLATLLSNRQAADEQLRQSIDKKTADWGISVRSVEIRDVKIPVALQDAMSRQAQAEREKQARVILGSAEAEIAGKFVEASDIYADHPAALQLRAMNIIYETTKERGTTILIPTSMVDSMNPASALVLAGQGAPNSATSLRPAA